MSLRENLLNFSGALADATSAPDGYDFPDLINFESNMRDLEELWAEIAPRLVRDRGKIQFISEKLIELKAEFLAGNKERGVRAVMDIYNLNVRKFR
jgi:hypothetical protein